MGQPLSLTSLPANVSQVRLTWAASSAVIFVGALFGSLDLVKLIAINRLSIQSHYYYMYKLYMLYIFNILFITEECEIDDNWRSY